LSFVFANLACKRFDLRGCIVDPKPMSTKKTARQRDRTDTGGSNSTPECGQFDTDSGRRANRVGAIILD